MNILLTLLVGLIAGAIATAIMDAEENGWVANIILGLFGAFVGNLVFGLLDIATTGVIGELVAATIGAVIIIGAVRMIKNAAK